MEINQITDTSPSEKVKSHENIKLKSVKEQRRCTGHNIDVIIDKIPQDTKKDEIQFLWWQSFLRIAFALLFAFDVGTDINLAIETFQFREQSNHFLAIFLTLLIFFLIGGLFTSFTTRKMFELDGYPSKSVSIFLKTLSLFGIDTIFYYIYAGVTKSGSKSYEKYSSMANSSRKLYGTFQSLMSSFICAHYLFDKPLEHSNWAIAGLILSMSNAIATITIDLKGKELKKWILANLFSIKFFSILPEIVGRPLFFGATQLIIIEKSTFLSEKSEPRLTFEFFTWDAICVSIACLAILVIDICRGLTFRNVVKLLPQIFVGIMIQRPPTDLLVFKVKGLINQYIIGLSKLNNKDTLYHIKLCFGFPMFWRFCEYTILMVVTYHKEFLSVARQYKVETLAYMSIVWNVINLGVLVICFGLIMNQTDKLMQNDDHKQQQDVEAIQQHSNVQESNKKSEDEDEEDEEQQLDKLGKIIQQARRLSRDEAQLMHYSYAPQQQQQQQYYGCRPESHSLPQSLKNQLQENYIEEEEENIKKMEVLKFKCHGHQKKLRQ